MPLSYRVEEKMRFTDGGSRLTVNESLTLDGIPADAHRYKLGNRSALEWIISQYHSADADPNREGDAEYITRSHKAGISALIYRITGNTEHSGPLR